MHSLCGILYSVILLYMQQQSFSYKMICNNKALTNSFYDITRHTLIHLIIAISRPITNL